MTWLMHNPYIALAIPAALITLWETLKGEK